LTDKKPASPPLYPFDRLFIGYSLLMILLILAFGRPLVLYLDEMGFYAAMVALALVVIRYVDERQNRLAALIRLVYPALLFTFFYRATGGTVLMFFDHFFDPQLTAFERALWGINPTLYVDRHFTHLVWLNEIFSFGYFSYYLMIPGFLLLAFFKRHDWLIKSSMTAMCTAFYISYLVFSLFPVESPRWFFAGRYVNDIFGPVLRPMARFVVEVGGLQGGGMPSSHVAVALVIMFYCLKYYRRLGLALVPVNLLLAVGTVWGRFHYVSDVVAGIVVGIASVVVVWKFYDLPADGANGKAITRKLKVEHAP